MSVIFLDAVDSQASFLGDFGTGIFQQHLVVIDQGASPLTMSFVVAGNVVAAACLLGLERVDFLLRERHALVLGMQRDEVGKIGNRLGSDTLIVIGLFGLLEVGIAHAEQGVDAFG